MAVYHAREAQLSTRSQFTKPVQKRVWMGRVIANFTSLLFTSTNSLVVTLVAISSTRVFKLERSAEFLERSAEFLRTSRNTPLKKSFTIAFLVRSTLNPLIRLLASSSDTTWEV